MKAEFSARKARFDRLCADAIRNRHTQGEDGVGTLAEKRLHALIKAYLCADPACHEVKLDGTRFVSDVRVGNEIYEVQTGDFAPMKKKIDHYLTHTDCTVTVVHPIPTLRWMSWVDPATMEIAPRRRVPRTGRAADLLARIYALAPHLQNPRLQFRLLLLETYDFRLLNGRSPDRKRGASRYERVPLALRDELFFESPNDFRALMPTDLPSHFTVKQFSALTGVRGRDAYAAVRALAALGLIEATEPIGRAMGWRCL